MGTTRTYTPGASGSNSGKQRTVICYNYKGEGHMSKQCTKPKRKRDDSWFKDKVLLVQAQANGQILHEEELAFLADLGIAEVALMANLSHYGSDALAEVHNPDNVDNNMINQGVQVIPSSEQSNVVNHLETKITSNSNIIPYSQNMNGDKVKKDIEEIETLNIELDHRVSKLITENEHLKQTYKQLYDSTKPTRIRSKEQSDALINQVNQKSVEISELNENLQEKVLVISALKNELRKLKGKDLADNVVTKNTIASEMLKIDVEPIAPKLLNNRTAHSDYLRHTQEQAAILREVVKQGKSQNPLNNSLDSSLKPSTSASGSQPLGNTKKDKIQRTPSSTQKNKIESHLRTVKSSLKNNNCFVEPKGNANVQHSKLNANSELLCVRITTTAEVPLRKPTALESDTPKPVVTLVYSRKPKKSKTNVPVVQIVLWYLDSGCSKHMTRDHSQLTNFVNKFLGTVKFGIDHVAKILGYGDYHIGNVTISRVYYVEGLGHNLFFVGQFCDSNLEVAFRQHTYFIRNLEGVDLLTRSRGNVVTKHTIAPEMLKIDVEPIAPRLLNNRTAHSDYLKHTQEQAVILREIVE
ncbi:hypothetical protein Tco_0087797 [Tanacetum coccineum]